MVLPLLTRKDAVTTGRDGEQETSKIYEQDRELACDLDQEKMGEEGGGNGERIEVANSQQGGLFFFFFGERGKKKKFFFFFYLSLTNLLPTFFPLATLLLSGRFIVEEDLRLLLVEIFCCAPANY